MGTPEDLFRDRPGEFLVGRDIYRDPQVLEWELRYIFEGTWNFVGLASQVPRPFDYLTTYLGRTPIIVSRDGAGELHCLVNSCRHKGALVCHSGYGNSRTFVCRYHGWIYDPSGRNVLIRDRAAGGYGPRFDAQCHDLERVARFGSYRGLLFASLNPQVPALEVYLGDLRPMIDLIVDRSRYGVECVPGSAVFTYKGNWKLQMENGVDPYHFSATHQSYILALRGRDTHGSVYSDFNSARLERGTYAFAHGHNAMWGPAPSNRSAPLGCDPAELVARVGEARARWMTYVRNITLFPNAQLAENAALQLRTWRPLAVDLTEMKTFCVAPVGEDAAARTQRLRQYEEFFNPSGLATPDDIANYEDCQRGLGGRSIAWQQGAARGEAVRSAGPHPSAAEIGVTPLSVAVGSFNLGDETVLQPTYRYWRELIETGLRSAGDARG